MLITLMMTIALLLGRNVCMTVQDCDVSCIFKIIQNGSTIRQFPDLNKNISRTKGHLKKQHLICIVGMQRTFAQMCFLAFLMLLLR